MVWQSVSLNSQSSTPSGSHSQRSCISRQTWLKTGEGLTSTRVPVSTDSDQQASQTRRKARVNDQTSLVGTQTRRSRVQSSSGGRTDVSDTPVGYRLRHARRGQCPGPSHRCRRPPVPDVPVDWIPPSRVLRNLSRDGTKRPVGILRRTSPVSYPRLQ